MWIASYVAMYLHISDIALCTSCNMGARDLVDMYSQSLRAYISGKA